MSLKFDLLSQQFEVAPELIRIKWDFENEFKANAFYRAVFNEIRYDSSQLLCHDTLCHSFEHRDSLENMWHDFKKTVVTKAKQIFGTITGRRKVVPGWNDMCKDLYALSREAFLAWRRDGSPRHGASAVHMRNARARFKLALRLCKNLEQNARADALAQKFNDKNVKKFWADIKTLNKSKPKLPNTVDGISGNKNICKMWENKFANILNSVEDHACKDELYSHLETMEESPVVMCTPDEIMKISEVLAGGKSPGNDNIPVEFFKNATQNILQWLSNFFNAILIHAYVPSSLTEVVICPLLKSSLKDPCSSSNYRPIAHATAASKIIENLILNRIQEYLRTSDFQFGFKKGHGTDVGIFVLKDLINFYKKLNSPTFLCFLDIKSCFDLISYNKLFCILSSRGVPKYIILLLLNWYTGQNLMVRWGNALSEKFNMSNGIRQGSCLSVSIPIFCLC